MSCALNRGEGPRQRARKSNMDPVLFGKVLMVVIIITMTLVCLQLVMMWGSIIDSVHVWRAYVGYALWLFVFLVICGLLGDFDLMDASIYAGIPWPYVLSFFFLFIPVINNTRLSGSLSVILLVAFLTNVFFTT